MLIDTDGNGDFTDGVVFQIVPDEVTNTKLVYNTISQSQLPDGAVFTFVVGTPSIFQAANLWLKADQGVSTNGSQLTGWTDQTGTNTFSVSGTVSYNTGITNFNPTVSMSNPAGQGLPSNRLTGNTSISVVDAFAVYKVNTSFLSTIIGSTSNQNGSGPTIFGSVTNINSTVLSNGTSNSFYTYGNGSITSKFTVNNFDVSPSVSPNVTARLNGSPRSLNVFGSPPIFTDLTFIPVIGGSNIQWNGLDGDIAEIILFRMHFLKVTK
ncbi:hypothetical protein V8V91_17815 [Algoriphagus halophilus]|uniref:hypothetical protein n=1 Tax=Algoriphagus halophilus TaxID=226505 RepID=UPI00358E1E13